MNSKDRSAGDVFSVVEAWCSRHHPILIGSIMVLFSIFSLLLFNLRVSEGGDDSTYIIRAVNFINNGTYPSFQGPLYPLFLSLLVGLFGIKLGLLKLSSFALMLTGIWFIYRVFKERVNYTLLFSTLLISSLSSFYIYFSSQTYSEALFILIQIPVFAFVFKLIDDASDQLAWKPLILLSLTIVAGYLTRTVGVGALIAVLLFMTISKRWKEMGVLLISCAGILFLFLLIKQAIWSNGWFDGGQASTLMYKHPYQLDQGKETLSGFISRFIDNSNLYLSKHFLHMIGLKDVAVKSTNGLITLVLYVLFLVGSLRAFKRNKYILFTAIYVATMLGITFIVLQKLWDQYRLIVPFFSMMLLVVLYGLFQLAEISKSKMVQRLVLGLVLFSAGSAFSHSVSEVDLLTLRKNLRGDLYEGYTDDWRNYLSMAEYVGKELPEQAYVAVRKPNMARIYANGKKFYGIYRYDTNDPDELLKRLKERQVSHVIMASLRKNPAINNGQTINTIQRYLYIISQKYPLVFKLEHQIGTSEPAYLFRVDYDAAKISE
ncbi:glycosyltransferase family 39 protein [Carboxylicivirga mesophila]|uniref:Glycosyltransferase family 39 protein n=1 Tax=Carboxylicivirga mesophila TaxID=1166478 RepID=A0ABS5K6U9_9BACT|nr:glycosyltransferase family 39 protein [Carboxylicivirga mesophila]MBS2210642.1 glycosyltransferase family 39 protein [Carboxylicivirga mesophila]